MACRHFSFTPQLFTHAYQASPPGLDGMHILFSLYAYSFYEIFLTILYIFWHICHMICITHNKYAYIAHEPVPITIKADMHVSLDI